MDSWVFEQGQWLHRPFLKRVVNSFLRAFQPQEYKYVIYTKTLSQDQGPPIVLGYGFGPIKHRS